MFDPDFLLATAGLASVAVSATCGARATALTKEQVGKMLDTAFDPEANPPDTLMDSLLAQLHAKTDEPAE